MKNQLDDNNAKNISYISTGGKSFKKISKEI